MIRAFVLCFLLATCTQCQEGIRDIQLLKGLELQKHGKLDEAEATYEALLRQEPTNAEAFHLLGLIKYQKGHQDDAVGYLRKAISIQGDKAEIWANLGEMLRKQGQFQEAVRVLQHGVALESKQNYNRKSLFNLGVALSDLGRQDDAIQTYGKVISGSSGRLLRLAVDNIAFLYEAKGMLAKAEHHLRQFVDSVGTSQQSCGVLFHLASVIHQQNRLTEAEKVYRETIQCTRSAVMLEPTGTYDYSPHALLSNAWNNLGATYQLRGMQLRALECFRESLVLSPDNGQTLNNAGACLWILGHHTEAINHYEKAIHLDPNCWQAYINLGNSFYESGDIRQAEVLFGRAISIEPSQEASLRARIAMMFRPVMFYSENKDNFDTLHSLAIKERLETLLQHERQARSTGTMWDIVDPISQVERLAFYWVYHGKNEYENQGVLADFFVNVSRTFLGRSQYSPRHEREPGVTPLVVGFISKFWHNNHAHGQLLAGVMRGLRETGRYHIKLLAIPHPLGGPSEEVLDAIGGLGNTVQLSEGFATNVETVRRLGLDALVFADTMSEPVTHFLTFFRLCPVQVSFWGNPVTSGGTHMDYFISGDLMEQGCAGVSCGKRNDGKIALPHYHEQLVRLRGLGIHYAPIEIPRGVKECREHPAMQIVYAVLQSSFKIHPAFDLVLKQVLLAVPNSRILMLNGRQETWTRHIRDRLSLVLGPLVSRVEFRSRVASSEEYLTMLGEADIVLQTFPFGGSKTSADAFALGLPVITMCGAYLRGRMTYAFYRKMGYMGLVATSVKGYIDLAVKLGKDDDARRAAADEIRARVHLIFDDNSVSKEWDHFLSRAIHSTRLEVRLRKDELMDAVSQAQKRGDLIKCKELMEELLEIRPANAELHNDLGATLQQLGHLEEALEHFNHAVRLENRYPVAHNNLGVTLQAMRQYSKAEFHYRRSFEQSVGWVDPLYNLGNLFRELGKGTQAYNLYLEHLGIAHLPIERQNKLIVLGQFALADYLTFETAVFGADVGILRDIHNRDLSSLANNAAKLNRWEDVDIHSMVFPLAEKLHLYGHSLGQETPGFVVLVTQFYQPGSDERAAELVHCLVKNLENPWIREIHLLTESRLEMRDHLPEEVYVVHSDKIKQVVIDRRLNFALSVEYANSRLSQGDIVAVANADIYFDDSISRAASLLTVGRSRGSVLALLRWEWSASRLKWFVVPRIDSQDSWVFRVPLGVSRSGLAGAAFELGRERCDNRWAGLLEEQGIAVRNPFLDIRTLHVHSEQSRPPTVSVPGALSFVKFDLPRFPPSPLPDHLALS